MPDPLDGIRLKFDRAHKQLQNLQTETDVFTDGKPYRVEREERPDGLEIVSILKEQTPVPPMWGVIIGEVIHDLRSMLDHLVWQLVIVETGAPPISTATQFPIFLDKIGYETRGEPRRLIGVGANARALIKSLQPFATGEGDKSPLWHLHELSNWDKHRNIVLTVATPTSVYVNAQPEEIAEMHVRAPGPLKHNTLAWGVRLKPSAVPFKDRVAKVQMNGYLSYCISFDQPPSLPNPEIFATMNAIGNRVLAVVKRFEKDIF